MNSEKNYSAVYSLLKHSGYISVHKFLIKSMGFDEALLYQLLVDKYEYFKDKHFLTKDENGIEWFYSVSEYIRIETELDRRRQKSAFDNLEILGLIRTKYEGVPRKKFFSIVMNVDILTNLLYEGEIKYKAEMKNLKNPTDQE